MQGVQLPRQRARDGVDSLDILRLSCSKLSSVSTGCFTE